MRKGEAKSFSAGLRAEVEELWRAQHQHPFVLAIGAGELDPERFRYWVKQDYLFLVAYCRLLALAAARSPEQASLRRLAELLNSTAVTEMSLHRQLAARLGLDEGELEGEEMSPTTQAYTDFLLRTAALGSFGELCSALLPCMWGFSELALRLAQGARPADPNLAAWIDSYSDPQFTSLASWCRELVDRLAEDAGETTRAAMAAAFQLSSRYELAFWDAAWDLQEWRPAGG